jgi:sensor histidine kinase YesM
MKLFAQSLRNRVHVLSIRKKLTLSVWVIAILPMLVIFLVISIAFFWSNLQSARDQAQLIANKAMTEMDAWIVQTGERNRMLATDLNIQNSISEYQSMDYKSKLGIRDFVRNRLINSYTSDMGVQNVSLYFKDEKKTFSSDYTDWDLYGALHGEAWFQNLLDGTSAYYLNWGKSVSTGEQVLVLASAITSNVSGKVLGLAYTELSPRKIERIFESLAGSVGTVRWESPARLVVGMPEGRSAAPVYSKSRQLDLEVEYRPNSSAITAGFRTALVLLVLGLLGMTALLYAVCTAFSRWFSGRIIVLRNATTQLADGALGLTVEDTHCDELADLAHSFNRMSAQIKQLIEDNYLARIENQEARLMALQSQINPHFIYNTLESISMMALLRDNYEIVDMAQAFSRMMRYAMQSEPQVSLSEELENTRCYLSIQKIRFPDCVSVEFCIGPGCPEQRILRLSLQPLVENAFIHGFEKQPNDRRLRIGARLRGADLMLYVYNDGQEIPRDKLAQIRALLAQDSMDTSLECFALRNLSRRLKLTYGSDARLCLRSGKGRGTLAVIHIPLKTTQQSGTALPERSSYETDSAL